MAKIKFYKNFLGNEEDTIEVKEGTCIKDCIEQYSPENPYTSNFIECYDYDTGEVWYEPLESEEETCVIIKANDNIVDDSYCLKEYDVVTVVFVPTSSGKALGGVLGGIVGAFAAALVVVAAIASGPIGWVGALTVGIVAAGVVVGGVFAGMQVAESMEPGAPKPKKTTGQKETKGQSNIEGSANQALLGNVYPFVIGKHLISPFIVGSPYVTYEGETGDDAYIHILYCAGYGPLKLTDFKLGDYLLAYNRSHDKVSKDTILSGTLRGYESSQGANDGDILNIWDKNDMSLEIIQQDGTSYNRGSIYNNVVIDKKIEANCLYIVDKPLTDTTKVVYKGASFPTNFKTNNVYFTESCPKAFTLVLSAPGGLYKSWTRSTEDENKVMYGSLPLWYCIQWRPYSTDNATSDSNGSDVSSWHTIRTFNDKDLGATFSEDQRKDDIKQHSGNKIEEQINGNFVNHTLTNFSSFSGEKYISGMRFSAHVEIPDDIIKTQILNDKNSIRGVEVRILRVSPCYQNEQNNHPHDDYTDSAMSFCDNIQISSLSTEVFDEENYIKTGRIEKTRAIPYDKDLDKFCYIALRAKSDFTGYLTSSLGTLTCMAESFSPIYDKDAHEWLPKDVSHIQEYYGYFDTTDPTIAAELRTEAGRSKYSSLRCNKKSGVTEVFVSYNEYLKARGEGFNWLDYSGTSDFASKMRHILFTNNRDGLGRYYLKEEHKKFNDNSSASGFMLAAVGPQNGLNSLSYDDINLDSVAQWKEDTEALKDGSTDDKGQEVTIRMEANAYIFAGIKIEDLLAKLAVTGRAVYTLDEKGKIKVIMDKPEDFYAGVINDQNCITSAETYDYSDIPAGLVMQFHDENDRYESNNIYCWSDGNSFHNYKGSVTSYNVDYVTNPKQAWSLGRYFLANQIKTKEIITRKIGIEGITFNIGDVVLVQSLNLLVGDENGRVHQILTKKDDVKTTYYGFVCDTPYVYKGDGTKGFNLFDPSNMGKNRIRTYNLAAENTAYEIDGINYVQKAGITTLVLFSPPIEVNNNSYNRSLEIPVKTGNIVMFGEVEKIAAPYRITKFKQEANNTFSETLVRYDESLYSYGDKLPAFQSYTKTVPVPKDPVTLSDVPTTIVDLNEKQNNENSFIQHQISHLYANHTVSLYKCSTSKIIETGITADATYDFSTNKLTWGTTGITNGWVEDPKLAEQQGKGDLYYSTATAIGKSQTAKIEAIDWSYPISTRGANGAAGLTIFVAKPALVFQAAADGDIPFTEIENYVTMQQEGIDVPFFIGDIQAPDGMEITVRQVTYFDIKVIDGRAVPNSGLIRIPINYYPIKNFYRYVDEDENQYHNGEGDGYVSYELEDTSVVYDLYVSYAKAKSGKSIGVIKEYYAISSSSTIAPPNEEFTAEKIPTMTEEKPYLWNFEKSLFTDDSTAVITEKIVIGSLGANGRSIKKVTNYYKLTVESSPAPDTTNLDDWKTEPLYTTPTERFLWNFELVEYDKEPFEEKTPAVIVGIHGVKGDSITEVKEFYAVNNDSKQAPEDSEFKEHIAGSELPSTSPTARFLWNYEEFKFGSSTNYEKTEPVVIGTYGDGISSITEYYKLTEDKTPPERTKEWSKTPPVTDDTFKYLWNYEVVKYDSGKEHKTEVTLIGTHGNKGDKGEVGDKGDRGPKYLGVRDTDPSLENVEGDFYLDSDSLLIFRYQKENGVLLWKELDITKPENHSYYNAVVNDIISLMKTSTSENVKTFVNVYIEKLLVGTAFIDNLFANKIRISKEGSIIGGDRYNEDGSIKDFSKPGFYLDADGISKMRIAGDRNNILMGEGAGDRLVKSDDEKIGGFNTCIGYQAGSGILEGAQNVCIGMIAGCYISRGSGNVCIGSEGDGILGGDENICIGARTRVRFENRDSQINIGNVFFYDGWDPLIHNHVSDAHVLNHTFRHNVKGDVAVTSEIPTFVLNGTVLTITLPRS